MATKSRALSKLPTDVQARERLREAQAVEATATAAVYNAHDALAAATAKRDALLAAASEAVFCADTALAASYAELISVSGLDRAALLLGLTKSELRRSAKADTNKTAGTDVATATASTS